MWLAPAAFVVHASAWAKRPQPNAVLNPGVRLTSSFSLAFYSLLHSCAHPVLRMLLRSEGGELLLLNGWIFTAKLDSVFRSLPGIGEVSSSPIQMGSGTLGLPSSRKVEKTQVLGLGFSHTCPGLVPVSAQALL